MIGDGRLQTVGLALAPLLIRLAKHDQLRLQLQLIGIVQALADAFCPIAIRLHFNGVRVTDAIGAGTGR